MRGKEPHHDHAHHRAVRSKDTFCVGGVRRVCAAVRNVCLTAPRRARTASVTTEALRCLPSLQAATCEPQAERASLGSYSLQLVITAHALCRLEEESVDCPPCPEPLARVALSMKPGLMILRPSLTSGSSSGNVEFRSIFVPISYSKIRTETRWLDTRLLLADLSLRLQIPVVAWNWQMKCKFGVGESRGRPTPSMSH